MYKSVLETFITHKYAPYEGLGPFSICHVCEQINFPHLFLGITLNFKNKKKKR